MVSGRTYGGRYRIIERVGAGGMAEVYRARDELLGREVALKILADRFARDRSFVERFRREAQSAAGLNHPNIVSLYDYGSDDGTYYIVMEFIDGRSLDTLLAGGGRLMPERAAEIGADIAKALERAHRQGIVHRDIKPGNIMLTEAGQTKVTDFGIARAVGGEGDQTMTQTGMVIGTAAYLSPEQAQGDPVDARSDVYSLGIVLYEMVTGQQPFTGDTPLSIAYKHVREQPVAPQELNPDVSDELNSVIMKCLAKNPANRYADAGAVAEDLSRFLAGQTVMATPMLDETTVGPATGTQVLRQTDIFQEDEPEEKRNAAAYVIGALLLLALIGLIAWLVADRFLSDTPTVKVPRVVGMTEDEARERLEARGLEANVERKPNRAEEGTVFKQDPPQGDEVDEGSEVTIFVSEGPRQVEVPDLSGLTEDEARELLRDEGLKVGEITEEPSDDVDAGQVIRQDTQPGLTVDAGTKIGFTVSAGAEIIVPNVFGFTEEDAIAAIEAEGLVAEVTEEPSDAAEGTVFAQEPAGGTEAEEGDVVVIAVSTGPEEREMPNVIGQDADEAQALLEDEYGLQVERADAEGACAQPPGTVCDQDPAEGTPVSEGDSATLFVQPGDAGLIRDALLALLELAPMGLFSYA